MGSQGEDAEIAELRAALASAQSQIGLLQRQALLLANRELEIQKERNRIAQEIHDGVAQNLAVLMLKTEIITRLADTDPQRMKAELAIVTSILESSVQELRASISSLRPVQGRETRRRPPLSPH